jgi:hypothetical protein
MAQHLERVESLYQMRFVDLNHLLLRSGVLVLIAGMRVVALLTRSR